MAVQWSIGKSESSQSIFDSSIQDCAVKMAARYVRMSPRASVTVIRLPAVRPSRVTAGRGSPSTCSDFNDVP
ncbi:hypothetical protein RKD47_005426 [Streptomyces albogriseolus]